jgi:transcriptional regulator with XRE-family HTH domain
MTVSLKLPFDIRIEIATRAKKIRLAKGFTQQGLALRSGVSLGSVKRFERTGNISLISLLKLAITLGCLDDFEQVFQHKEDLKNMTIEEMLRPEITPKRGKVT